MGLGGFLSRVLGGGGDDRPGGGAPREQGPRGGLGVDELAPRLGVGLAELKAVPVEYQQFTIPKRAGGRRVIDAPRPELKALQRRILRRLLGRLRSHPAATGFERGRSIVTNALPHAGAAIVVRMDVEGFFAATTARRVREYFAAIGWGDEAAELLTKWCTHEGRLPQGAPTSPRLSNLVNFALDARLAGVAKLIGAAYSRYADDITFSFAADDHQAVRTAIRMTKRVAGEYGYRLHHKRKLSIRRRHQSQRVTGLVVNDRPALPRERRRWLRAVDHHIRTGRTCTLTPPQLAGWHALARMVDAQSPAAAGEPARPDIARPSPPGGQVAEELARARQRLLDLTMRNRLLNFRPTRRTTVPIVDELPAQVWQLLVAQAKKLAFLAREEHELIAKRQADPPVADEKPDVQDYQPDEAAEDGELFSLPDVETIVEAGQEALPARYTDLLLQTPLAGEVLQTNLLHIERQGRSALEERGVNLLFLAMGFLQWRPVEERSRWFLAPLVLVPVGLERTSAARRFKLRALDDEPVLNPCLIRKLHDYRIDLPAAGEDWEGFDIDAFFAGVERAVAGQDGWQVVRQIHLGFFSFTKYLMYVDLDPPRWPADRGLLAGGVLRAVCGDTTALAGQADLPAGERLDETLDPEDVFQVLDADSSQQEAILAAKNGASLVIEGPPGTGKSQTIANIIGECLSQGRTVLFVSEKMAALEVVKRRLDQVGLGDFCLELHSTKANRRSVAEELGRVLAKGRYEAGRLPGGARKLLRLRERLNGYVAALHEPAGAIGETPYRAMGRVALLGDVPDVFCAIPGREEWTPERLEAMKDLMGRLARQVGNVGEVEQSPWRGARLTAAGAQTQRTVSALSERLLDVLARARQSAGLLAEQLGVEPPGSIREMHDHLAAAAVVNETPSPEPRLLTSTLWDEASPELKALLGRAANLVKDLQWMAGRYRAEGLDEADWAGLRDRRRAHGSSPLRFFRPAWWSDRGVLKRFREPAHRPNRAELADDLVRLAEAQDLRRQLQAAGDVGSEYFGKTWRGVTTDFSALLKLGDWLLKFRRLVNAGLIGAGGIALAQSGRDRRVLAGLAQKLTGQLQDWQDAWGELADALVLADPGAFDEEAAAVGCDDVARRLEAMGEQIESLLAWAQYQEVLQDCEAGPLAEFVARATAEGLEPEALPVAVEKQFLRLFLDDVFAEREALRRFNGPDHEADILAFARLDRDWVARTAYRLHGRLASDRPANGGPAAPSSQLGILQGEIRRKRGGRPIRKLLADAADAIRRLKPCFMMSPLSVAQFLAPEGMRFDVVVFDEASQVEPADALGAIARAGQLILVGDPKQLPPTTFFSVIGGEGDGGAGEGAAGLTDMESILDRGAVVLPTRRLRWHYRSRHESLIAFSNREFYHNDLVAFPSCHSSTEQLGLSMVYHREDAYDRGRGQTNRAQARRIAEWVFDHAARQGDVSLGVGAFSQPQQQAILDEIERLRRADESREAFFDPQRAEPFFVKNLETIQGDERDVILLSVGYGKVEPGERLSMNFGPLNQDGGWRRLNVLITRARRRCVVFTSIVGEDFDLSATPARGVAALRGYLDFARGGKLPGEEPEAARASGSSFEQAVYNALTERGVRLARKVGCAGYAIDLAVIDPENPDRFILGIECDGPTYRDSATARDRDRLRRQVMEGLGWRVHRVWSTDWHRTPRAEIDRALEAIAQARAGLLKPLLLDRPSARRLSQDTSVAGAEYAEVEAGLEVALYERYAGEEALAAEDFYPAAAEDLARQVAAIVEVEGPIHASEVTRRVAGLYGFARAGARIEEKIARAVALAASRQSVIERGEFYWPKAMTDPPVRRRGDDDESVRDIELICLEEIGRAARMLLEAQFGMGRDDLIVQTARLLGFQHTGAKISERIAAAIQGDLDAGRIVADAAGRLTIATGV